MVKSSRVLGWGEKVLLSMAIPPIPIRYRRPAIPPSSIPLGRRTARAALAGQGVERGVLVVAEGQGGGGEVALQVRDRGGAGDRQHGGGAVQQPGERELLAGRAVPR